MLNHPAPPTLLFRGGPWRLRRDVSDRMANGIEKIERNTRPLGDADGVSIT